MNVRHHHSEKNLNVFLIEGTKWVVGHWTDLVDSWAVVLLAESIDSWDCYSFN